MLEFDWNETKADANWRKHGIRFAYAVRVFCRSRFLGRRCRMG